VDFPLTAPAPSGETVRLTQARIRAALLIRAGASMIRAAAASLVRVAAVRNRIAATRNHTVVALPCCCRSSRSPLLPCRWPPLLWTMGPRGRGALSSRLVSSSRRGRRGAEGGRPALELQKQRR